MGLYTERDIIIQEVNELLKTAETYLTQKAAEHLNNNFNFYCKIVFSLRQIESQ